MKIEELRESLQEMVNNIPAENCWQEQDGLSKALSELEERRKESRELEAAREVVRTADDCFTLNKHIKIDYNTEPGIEWVAGIVDRIGPLQAALQKYKETL